MSLSGKPLTKVRNATGGEGLLQSDQLRWDVLGFRGLRVEALRKLADAQV